MAGLVRKRPFLNLHPEAEPPGAPREYCVHESETKRGFKSFGDAHKWGSPFRLFRIELHDYYANENGWSESVKESGGGVI